MFSITRTTGIAALLAVSVLMPWSSDALAAGHRRNQAVEHRQTATHHSRRGSHPEIRAHRRHGPHPYARQLVRKREHLLERGTSALFRADFERAGQLFWRANRVEHRLHQLRRLHRRHDRNRHHDDRRHRR
jgi:hypothetical protein